MSRIDFKELIETGNDFARIEFTYQGSADSGMMAWLDGDELKLWWKADDAIIEPYPGGMFYITWGEKTEINQHAILGVMDIVDVESRRIEITKILYMSPAGKIGPTHLRIKFEVIGETEARIILKQMHPHKGQLQKLYNAAVFASWPKTFGLLKKYLENKK